MKRIIAFLLCFFTLIPLIGCGDKDDKFVIYFASSDGRSFDEEYVKVDEGASLEETAELVVKKMLEGPSKAEHKRVIPENTALLGVGINGKTATVNFSQEFESTGNHAERLLAMYSVVNTLCAIDGINKVQIMVNGAGIKTVSGEEVGAVSMNKVIMEDGIGKNQTAILVLYFANEDKTGLVSERRVVDIKDNETVEKTAVTELLKGPENKGVKILTSDIKVLKLDSKDGTCYLTLSKEFLSLPADSAELCIYSIVNTLTGLPEISFVQFFVEGEIAESIGNVTLSEPFSYNSDLVD